MIKVLFHTESHYPVDKKIVKLAVTDGLKGKVKRDAEVSVSIVGNRKIHELNKKYRNIDQPTDVLSFALSESNDPETRFIESPDDVLRLGDIVVSYPEAIKLAKDENLLVDDAINKLILHGLNHLLGIHHPE
jgi:probable rRNA maturation factor